MSAPKLTGRQGFTLLELLTVIGIILLLSALTFGALRASRTHLLLDHSAAQLSLALEYGKALAQAEGIPVYLAVADHGVSPAVAAMRAWTLLRKPTTPELLREWTLLPKDCVFAPDPSETGDGDLVAEGALQLIPDAFVGREDESSVIGPLRLLVEITPEGRFVTAGTTAEKPRQPRLVMRRADWFLYGSTWMVAPWTDSEMDAVRLRLRPLTGVVVQERVLPPLPDPVVQEEVQP